MYTIERLQRYAYFEEVLKQEKLENLLDSLTGVLARQYILGFAQWLIARGTPFTFAMLDLDNFKFINDTYGHQVGDVVLSSVAGDLAAYVADRGIVGRYGGDELLIINLRDRSYDEKKRFLGGVYADCNVLRKNVSLPDCTPFITGTIGCATFPDDAQDYDTLFMMIDKTLYRGKTKGRNCHIIYVEAKHKDIEIRQIARSGVYTSMHSLVRQLELAPGPMNKLRAVMPQLMQELRISDLYYVNNAGRMRAIRNTQVSEEASDIAVLMDDDLFFTNELERIARKAPIFYGAMKKREVETFLAVRVSTGMAWDGYLVCAEARSRRIWQEDECAIMYFLAKLLSASMRADGRSFDD